MNIKQVKKELIRTIQAYLLKNEDGEYRMDFVRQRPVLLIGPPGIGKTAVMEQVAKAFPLSGKKSMEEPDIR